jgi:hypothetical protein
MFARKFIADNREQARQLKPEAREAFRSIVYRAAHRTRPALGLRACSEVRTLLGLRVHQAGLVYSIGDHSVVGRVTQGRRTSEGWSEVRS